MSHEGEDRGSPVARLAHLNGALRALIADSEDAETLNPNDARDLARRMERLLGTVADMRNNPAMTTPDRLHALADALDALLTDIGGTPDAR